MKRAFDVAVSLAGLVLLSPLFLCVALVVRLDSRGPVLFRQERVGRGFRPFRILKFRTMARGAETAGPAITVGGDPRVTRVGAFLRRFKLDELPQLVNVLRGEMSLVGPRPEVLEYVSMFRREYERLLRVRPGLTDPASMRFSREEKLLAGSDDWERTYVERILPAKIRLSAEYIERRSMRSDLGVIMGTLLGVGR